MVAAAASEAAGLAATIATPACHASQAGCNRVGHAIVLHSCTNKCSCAAIIKRQTLLLLQAALLPHKRCLTAVGLRDQ